MLLLPTAILSNLSRDARGMAEVMACDTGASLALDLVQTIPVSIEVPPAALVLLDQSNFLALDHSGAIQPFGDDPVGAQFPDAVVLAGLGRGSEGAVAFTDHKIFRYATYLRKWSPVETTEQFSDIRSVVGDPSGSDLWIVEGPERERTVYRLREVRGGPATYSVASMWRMAGSWRLTPTGDGHAVAVSTRFPFAIMRLSEGDQALRLGSLGAAEDFEVPDSIPLYASAVTRLDCHALLITMADLASSRRWLFVVDGLEGELLTQGEIDSTMGFFDSLLDRRKVFAYRDTGSGGEVLVYRWAWIRRSSTP